MRYLFAGTYPVIATGLTVGPDVTVTHTGEGYTVAAAPDGSTVVLHPGDVLEVRQPYVHALLHQLDDDLADHLTTTFGVTPDTEQPAAVEAPAENQKD